MWLCVRGCSACKPLLTPSALGKIRAILLDTCLDYPDLCGPAPCALGPGWMDTRRALFPETDEFVKWKFWYKWTKGHDQLRENIQRAGIEVNLCLLLKQSAFCFHAPRRPPCICAEVNIFTHWTCGIILLINTTYSTFIKLFNISDVYLVAVLNFFQWGSIHLVFNACLKTFKLIVF